MAETQNQNPKPPAARPPEAQFGNVRSARETVSVACRLPGGIIIRGTRPETRPEPILGGGTREVTIHEPTGEQVVIRGTAARPGAEPPILIGGYRITPDVPKHLWDAWLEANRSSDLVRNHVLFAQAQQSEAKAQARAHEGVVTGLEGIDPKKPGARVGGRIAPLDSKPV